MICHDIRRHSPLLLVHRMRDVVVVFRFLYLALSIFGDEDKTGLETITTVKGHLLDNLATLVAQDHGLGS